MKKKVLFLLLICCSLFELVSCKKGESAAKIKSKTFYTYFDTVITVYSYADEAENLFEQNCKQIEDLFDRYNRLFDIYHEYSGVTNLCTVNSHAGETLVVDPEIIDLLDYAKDCYDITNGEVNIMLGAVLKLWKQNTPSGAELSEASEHCNIESLVLDSENNTVTITDALASIDVGAVAKGYATEKVAQFLIATGTSGYVINAGGNVRLIGKKPVTENWNIAIQNPDPNAVEYSQIFSIHDTSCVTSGLYERGNHIIDKDTMQPPEYFSSVSIITEDSAYADVLSTALFCMNHEDGMNLQKELGDFEVFWLTRDGQKLYSGGMKQYTHEE